MYIHRLKHLYRIIVACATIDRCTSCSLRNTLPVTAQTVSLCIAIPFILQNIQFGKYY